MSANLGLRIQRELKVRHGEVADGVAVELVDPQRRLVRPKHLFFFFAKGHLLKRRGGALGWVELVAWLAGQLAGCLVPCLRACMIGWLVRWLLACLLAWLDGGLVSGPVGWCRAPSFT